jgi:hypothetical protein
MEEAQAPKVESGRIKVKNVSQDRISVIDLFNYRIAYPTLKGCG